MARTRPSFLLTIWMIGFALTGIMDILAPAFLGSFFVWGSGAGWQREAGLWNLAAALTLNIVIQSRSRDIQRGLTPLLAILSLLFAANHLIALMVSPKHLAHWAQVIFYGLTGTAGLSSSVLGDLDATVDADDSAPQSRRHPVQRTSTAISGSPESQERGRKISEAIASMKRRSKKQKPIEIKRTDHDFD